MKRLFVILVLFVIYSVLIIPVIVSADTSGTITISGRVPSTMDLDVPSEIDFGTFNQGSNTRNSADPGTVTSNSATYYVKAIDQSDGDKKGRMSSGSDYLSGALQISNDQRTYDSAGTGIVYTYTSSPGSVPFYVTQNISTNDRPGNYTITIVFTASITN